MSFEKDPAGASSDFALIGTDGIDITTIAGSAGPVFVEAFGDRDQVTIQSTDGVADSFSVDLGDDDDRIFADARPNFNLGDFFITNSIFFGGKGDDILFGDVAGDTNLVRTAFFQDSWIFGNQGADIIRTYGLLNSGVEGNAGRDKIELTNDFSFAPALGQLDPLDFLSSQPGIINNEIVNNPDRYDNSTVSGGKGADTVELKLGNTNVVNSLITGNRGNDLITNFRINDLSGNFQNSTIRGAAGADTIDLQDTQVRDFDNNIVDTGFVTSDLLVLGDAGRDILRTGIGNDSLMGGKGDDFINDAGGINLIFGDNTDGTGAGDDVIQVNVNPVFANRNNFNTVFAGDGADIVTLNSDGNNNVFGDSGANASRGGADTIIINGDGNNFVRSDTGNDTVQINGGGSNTVFGRAGADTIRGTLSRDLTFFGNSGDDLLVSADLTGAANISGGKGSDQILFNNNGDMTSAIFDGGKDNDLISNFVDNERVTYVQENGDSVAATAVRNLDGEFFTNGSAIRFENGVDLITNFGSGTASPISPINGQALESNVFDTDLGQLGLDQTRNGGEGGLYDGNELSAQSGFVFGRSYFLRGDIAPVDNSFEDLVFTIDAEFGEDAIIVTEGNNQPFTSNENIVVLQDYGALVADLNNSNFI